MTRHGEEVAVVVDVTYFRALTGVDVEIDFKKALMGPAPLDDDVAEVLDGLVADRAADLPRGVDFTEST